jgi:hypothetical protein
MTEDDELKEIRHGIRRLRAETMRQLELSRKLTGENFWYPLAIATSLVISVAAVTLLVIKVSLG